MSVIDKLIKQHCPDGVRKIAIGEVILALPKEILKNEFILESGPYPVYNSGCTIQGYYSDYNNNGDAFMVASRGESAGFISYSTTRFWAGGLCYPYRSKDSSIVSTRYLYYVLKHHEKDIMTRLVSRGGIPAINKGDFERYFIPLPPLPVQQEVVRILDSFTDLQDNLQQELEARQKQYKAYREELLSFNGIDGIQIRRIGDFCEVLRGKRLTKDMLSDSEGYPVFHGGLEPLGYYSQKNRERNSVMVINVGASAGTIGYSHEEFWSSDGCYCLSNSSDVNSRYLYYALLCKERQIKGKVRYAGIPTLDAKVVADMSVIIPPLEKQQELVNALDVFEDSINNIQSEYNARQKQYEYYRDQLLTF